MPTDSPNADSPSPPPQIEEVEGLVRELRRLLVRHESSLDAEDVRGQLETLERWAESYRRGLEAAEKISGTGRQWLDEAQQRLKLAAAELQRLDAESPAAASAEETQRAEDYIRATRRIEALIPAVDHAMPPAAPESERTA